MEDKQNYNDLQKRVEKLEQDYAELKGQTEPIKITRLEIDPGGMQELLVQANKRLERIIQTQTDRSEQFETLERGQQEIKQELLQEMHTISHHWIDSLQGNVDHIKADISNIKATQSDQGELLKDYGKRFDRLETTQSDHGELLKDYGKRFDRLETTQSDHGEVLKEHGKRFDRLETTLSDHGEVLKEHGKRFDRLEITQTEQSMRMHTMDSKLDQILTLLQQS
jgi:chromosome segregation ATPase